MQLKATKTKYYVNNEGYYIGAFIGVQKLVGIYEDGSEVILHPGEFPPLPEGTIEVSFPPISAVQRWDNINKSWSAIS